MTSSTQQPFTQLSQQFFSQCPQLKFIQEPFNLAQSQEQLNIRDLQTEFQLIRSLTETKKHRLRLRTNAILQNKKNRYPEQSIFEHSRVKLKLKQNTIQEDNQQESSSFSYINANYIPNFIDQGSNRQISIDDEDFKLILTQGPTQNTVEDLKSMIFQQKIQCVIMLCRLIQNGKSRCSDYIGSPQNIIQSHPTDESCTYLTTKTISLGPQYQKYSYHHVYYSEWPDKKVPSELEHILHLIQKIRKYNRIVVHCSAGLGRSGVVAALLLIMKSRKFIEQNRLSVFQTVRRMRQYRFGAVQNSQQYAFLYKVFKQISLNQTSNYSN